MLKEQLQSIEGKIELLALGLHYYTQLYELELPGPILAAVKDLDEIAYELQCLIKFSQPKSEPSSQTQN